MSYLNLKINCNDDFKLYIYNINYFNPLGDIEKMKYLIILTDGAADQPIASLGGKTPLMAANTPNMDKLCAMSQCGTLKTVPDSLEPGSEVANMTIMGYDAATYYQGRGVLEATALGVDFDKDDLVFRCNLVSVDGDTLINHSAGHISNHEAKVLIDELNNKLADDRIKFYAGVSYRNVLIIKGARNEITCTPPHDIPNTKFADYLPDSKSDTSALVRELMLKSREVLESHEINTNRKAQGKTPANMFWAWSPGNKPDMPSLKELYGINSGVVISAVDLIHGLGKLAGLKSIHVEGATGLYDTNYAGKAQAALNAIDEGSDFVFLHIEAPDEAGHEGNIALKIKTIEDIDKYVVSSVLEYIENSGENLSLAVLPDHPTPCEIRTHTRDDVPFMIYNPNKKADKVSLYNEVSVRDGAIGRLDQTEFIRKLLQ